MSRGYDLFDVDGTGILELQRDDEAAVFPDDDAAWRAFLDTLAWYGNHPVCYFAHRLLENWRPHMARLMREGVLKEAPQFESPATSERA